MPSTLWTIALLSAFISPSSHGFVATPPRTSSTSGRSAQNFRHGGAKCTPPVAPNVAAASRQRSPGHASLQQNTGRRSFKQYSVGEGMDISAATGGLVTASSAWAEERFPGCSTVVSPVSIRCIMSIGCSDTAVGTAVLQPTWYLERRTGTYFRFFSPTWYLVRLYSGTYDDVPVGLCRGGNLRVAMHRVPSRCPAGSCQALLA